MGRKEDIKAIWSIWNGVGMDREDLYEVISRKYKKERMTFMTDGEIANLRKFVSGYRSNLAAVFGVNENLLRMTKPQWWKIKRQMEDLGWSIKTLCDWIVKHNMAMPWTGFLEDVYPDDARKIITALEKMRTAKQRKEMKG